MGKRLDDGQPLVEFARKMKAIEGSQPSTIWKEDSVSCNPSIQSSRTPSRPSKRSSMSEVWERSEHLISIEPIFKIVVLSQRDRFLFKIISEKVYYYFVKIG